MTTLQEKNQEATVYVGNLDERIHEGLLWELMVQAGPIASVYIPKDRATQQHQGYAFCEFQTELDADYACKIMNMIRVWGKPLRVNKASADRTRVMDVGATLFVGNLAPEVDERLLMETFQAFGHLLEQPRIQREGEDLSVSRGFGFVSFDNFESSDAAMEAMNGQWLANRQITVTYALKKNGKGERHGSEAERLLAAQGRKNIVVPVHQPTPMPLPPHMRDQPPLGGGGASASSSAQQHPQGAAVGAAYSIANLGSARRK